MSTTDTAPLSITISGAPAWFSAQTSKTWSAPVTNTIHAVRPSPLPSGNVPPGMSVSTANVVHPWSGGAYDTDRQAFMIFGGGHGDYAGNEVYEVEMNVASPAWARVTNPSSTSGGSQPQGTLGDGQPRSFHTYDMLTFVPGVGMFCVGSPAQWPSGYSGNGAWRFNRHTPTPGWTRIGNVPGPMGGPSGTLTEAYSLGTGKYDSTSGLIYCAGAGAPVFYTINPVTSVISQVSVDAQTQLYITSAISPTQRVWIARSDYSGTRFRVVNLNNNAVSAPSVSGTFPSHAPGLVWHPASNAFLCWNGGATIYKITASNWTAGPYTSTAVTNSGGGVTPSAVEELGTYGRLQLAPNLGGPGIDALVALNHVNEPVYVYKLPAVGV